MAISKLVDNTPYIFIGKNVSFKRVLEPIFKVVTYLSCQQKDRRD